MLSNAMFVYDHQGYSYRDLHKSTLWLNRFFVENNVSRVLICLPQGFTAYSAIISAYMSEVTFCCLNHSDPLEKKQMHINELQPQVVICQKSDEKIDHHNILYDYDIQLVAETNGEIFNKANNNVAYIYYTSGTTGKPKGVCIRRESFEHAVLWITNHFGIQSNDICSQYPNLNFDMSLVDIFVAAAAGASLVPFSSFSDKLFPTKKIAEYGITFWNSVPGVIDMLERQNKLNHSVIHTIKKFKFGGDEILPRHMKNIFAIQKDAKIFLSYGPTEVTLFCCCLSIHAGNYMQYAKHNMSLGELLPGWNLLLTNVENGVGQIVIYGDLIGLGYLDQEQDGFRTLIIDGQPHRAYETGDYAQYLDGNLYFVCRKDMQVKLNGNRVDLSEITRIARSQLSVEGCTIYHNKRIYFFYVSETISEDKLRSMLQNHLPSYLIPHHVVPISFLPKNVNGKIDQAKLIEDYCL